MKVDSIGIPLAVREERKVAKVAVIEDCWKVEEEWWRQTPVARSYYEVVLENGRRLTIFRDDTAGCWFQQRGYGVKGDRQSQPDACHGQGGTASP